MHHTFLRLHCFYYSFILVDDFDYVALGTLGVWSLEGIVEVERAFLASTNYC